MRGQQQTHRRRLTAPNKPGLQIALRKEDDSSPAVNTTSDDC